MGDIAYYTGVQNPANVSFQATPVSKPLAVTPAKRMACQDPSPQSLSKKAKLTNWNEHRQSNDIPATPKIERNLDETYEAEDSSSVGESPNLGCKVLNDSLTIVNKLEKVCEVSSRSSIGNVEQVHLDGTFSVQAEPESSNLNVTVSVFKPGQSDLSEVSSSNLSSAPAVNCNETVVLDKKCMDSTFAVTSDEPMEVDLTSYVLNLPCNIVREDEAPNYVKIEAHKKETQKSKPCTGGFGNISPISKSSNFVDHKEKNPASKIAYSNTPSVPTIAASGQRRSPRINSGPSSSSGVLKNASNSTKKDTTSTKKFTGPKPKTPQGMGGKLVRRQLTSVSTSVLPKAGSNTQPPSFKVVNDEFC